VLLHASLQGEPLGGGVVLQLLSAIMAQLLKCLVMQHSFSSFLFSRAVRVVLQEAMRMRDSPRRCPFCRITVAEFLATRAQQRQNYLLRFAVPNRRNGMNEKAGYVVKTGGQPTLVRLALIKPTSFRARRRAFCAALK
jgi:hypothetical protein